MSEGEEADEFEYRGHLVFNGIFSTRLLTIVAFGSLSSRTGDCPRPECVIGSKRYYSEGEEYNREALRTRLSDRLYPYQEGIPSDPGKGYIEIDLENLTRQATNEGILEPGEGEVLLPIAQDVISQKYIKEQYDTEETVDSEGNAEERMVRNLLTTYVFWDFPDYLFIKGAEQSAKTTAADTRSALVVDDEGSISADGGTVPGVRLDSMDFDSHFLLWLVYKDYSDESGRVKLGVRRSKLWMPMAKTDRLSDSTGWIDLEFVERERTPREIIKAGIRHHLAGLSLSNTVILLEDLGVERSRTAVHNWVQKADLQPAGGESPDRVAVDQKAIRVNDHQYWLYAAVDPETNKILHSRLFPTYTIPIAREFLAELAEKHDVDDAVFLVDDADDLIGGLRRDGYSYRVQQHGWRNAVERVFREVERRTSSFSNCFSHVDPATAETWLQAHAVWWNHV